ncbi:MAG: septum formation initiator family protein [Bacteroidales bacterium]|jgi:cell division protein FtsB|nr:septum formation initiator family protein [Bacteroidales bacterium]
MKAYLKDIRDAFATLLNSKYMLVVIGFLLWMAFMDEDNIFVRYSYGKKIEVLEKEKAKLESEIESDKRKMKELKTNKESLEKFAREEYYMKKDNEVIFIIKD